MNRIRVGIAILLVMLGLCLAVTGAMQKVYPVMASLLEDAALYAEAGNFPDAQEFARQASLLWDRCHRFTAALADHAPMDDMDSLFAELETYGKLEELPHFAALCRNLSRLARSMGENHGMLWWNIF
jgi:hypothetical protein